jgi:hypothetical protein
MAFNELVLRRSRPAKRSDRHHSEFFAACERCV